MNKIVITSANTAHYVAENEQGWFWTRDYSTVKRFATRIEAETYARGVLPEMLQQHELWFLGIEDAKH